MSCHFCHSDSNDFVKLNTTEEYSGIEISMHEKGMLRCRYFKFDEFNSREEDGVRYSPTTFESQDIVNIRFCPICGRELIS